MRFYIMSDLHLRAKVEDTLTRDRIKRLCSKIRRSANMNEKILFIFLGDIADKGEELSFETARESLSLLQDELKDYMVKFEFVPGNHDLETGSLCLFDRLTSAYGSVHSYESAAAYSCVYEGVNFIFADSTLTRDYAAPGRLDMDAIQANVKNGMVNILFCHHALSHGNGSVHDTIEDSATVKKKLTSIGIGYLLHGHVHDAKVTIPENGLIEIGCGSLSGGISWLKSVFHQFLVGYIQNGRVARVERWIDAEDGHEDFAMNELYPKPREFVDPDSIDKVMYDSVDNYITRYVSLYEDAKKNPYIRLWEGEKQTRLVEALQRHEKILLLCDAGMGKSIELRNLAYELSGKFHTFHYSLENYSGQDICELLPPVYREIPENRIALLLDGYDEMDGEKAKQFKRKLKHYTQNVNGVKIVVSSRSNFCGNENGNESRNFQGFHVYVLEQLNGEYVNGYLESRGIDASHLWGCAKLKGIHDLLFNPFYLVRLADLYVKERDLPPKKQLMDKLISESFDVDDLKFAGDLDERYHELFMALESLAFGMQLMHCQSFDDREEYQVLLSPPKRDLVKKSGLLKRESEGWKFLHNNFREYLVAKCLSRIPKDSVVPLFFDGTNIKPSWVNVLGYLSGFDLCWNLVDWLIENAPTALVKFESDRLNVELRIEVFKRIYEKHESQRLYFNDDLCDEAELAHFVNSNEILSFLLEKISNPKHLISQYTAVNILRYYPCLFGRENEIREVLLVCCEQYPVTHKTVCRSAMLALCEHRLQTPEVTVRLMEKLGEDEEDYIRLGLYEYLFETGQHDDYVEYYLAGIKHITYGLNLGRDGRIGNEGYELVDILKKMSRVDSVTQILKWFSRKRAFDFHDSDEVLSETINTAVGLYNGGHKELFEVVLACYLAAAKNWNTKISATAVKFFVETNTLHDAAVLAAVELEDKPYQISDLLNADKSVMEYLKIAYMEGRLKSNRAFREIVLWFIREEKSYVSYAQLIKEIDGVELPEYKAPTDYAELERKSTQAYFDALFDPEEMHALYRQLVEMIDDPDLTTRHILDTNLGISYRSALGRLQGAMYRYGHDVKVSEFFNHINIDEFILWSASAMLNEKTSVITTQVQRDKMKEIISNLLKDRNFRDSIKYHTDGFTLEAITEEMLSLIQYLDYSLEESALLELTELPAFIFDRNREQTKYAFLKSRLADEKIKHRLAENVASKRVQGMVLRDHIEYFDNCKDPSLAEYVLELCKNANDISLRSTAWRYLKNTLGSEYVASEILPIADGELLTEIDGACKDISREKMREAMEREYKKKRSLVLQAHLITFGSSIAINDYVESVRSLKHPPEGTGTCLHGPTEAIGSIRNPEFIPQLEDLLVIMFDPEFVDGEWRGLRNSLMKAFVNCGTESYEEAKAVLLKHRPSSDENEQNYRFCNYTLQEIEHGRKIKQDVPKSLGETKVFLSEAQKYY